MTPGYMGKILWVDLSNTTLTDEALDPDLARRFVGGYGLGAKMLFDREDLAVIPFPTDYRGPGQHSLELLDFIPQADGLNNTEVAMKEFYGLLYYGIVR